MGSERRVTTETLPRDRRWAYEGDRTTADSHVYPCDLPLEHTGFCGLEAPTGAPTARGDGDAAELAYLAERGL